ncbi:MAG: hypothetical protein KAR24_01245 [Candidatus Pacebacteria bacterium]|nr:hypothetical protein [Candidatus Paceibacterota bacterium]
MSMYRKKIITALLSGALFFAPFLVASALTIAPARIEINGNPGQMLKGTYIIVNEQDTEKTFYSSFENFEAQGETGTPNFVEAQEGLATWIDSAKQITIKPGETIKLDYSITIPHGADPGGHFAAIFWGTTNPNVAEDSEKQVSIGAKIGVIILLRVNGDIEEGGGIIAFETVGQKFDTGAGVLAGAGGALTTKKFFTTLPIDFVYRFQNSGGDRIKPEGIITIKNTFGITTSVLDANPQKGNILPQSVRKYSIHWNGVDDNDEDPDGRLEPPKGFFSTAIYQAKHFAFGMYRTELELTYGAGEELMSAAGFTFFVVPWQLLTLVVLGGLLVLRLLKGYNQMIIRQAQKANVDVQLKNTE